MYTSVLALVRARKRFNFHVDNVLYKLQHFSEGRGEIENSLQVVSWFLSATHIVKKKKKKKHDAFL